MAAAAAVKDAITCCICFNVYRDPHALPCLHTLCKPCIDQLAVRGKVECPECREISHFNKIRKDFKTQSLIDAHNGKSGQSGGGSGVAQMCGMCREPGKVVNFHCKECQQFMCSGCEKTHKAIKVCRGHTVTAVKDIVQIAKSKLDACVDQWKMEKTKITTKANKIEIYIKSVQAEEKKQIELTNKHFDKLICDLEKKRLELVKQIREANEVSVQTLRENKPLYDQLTREIQSKIHMLQEVIDRKHASSMNNMVDDMDVSSKEQFIQVRNQADSFDLPSVVVPVKVHIDEKAISIATGIKLEITVQCGIGTDRRSRMLNINYLKLKTNRYQLSGRHSCIKTYRINRINLINNNVWCAAHADGIEIYDKNMQLIYQIKHTNYELVTGLAEWRGDVIVACAVTGLHQITQAGDYVQKITGGKFSDVSSNGNNIYGLEPHKIVKFTHAINKWIEKGEILLTDGQKRDIWDKLIANANSLFISLGGENSIEKYSLGGELQQTFGPGGSLSYPILSGVDVYGNLLVADVDNKQLKVYYSEEQTWQVVPLKLHLQPHDAVMDEHNVWVLACSNPSQILKYTKI